MAQPKTVSQWCIQVGDAQTTAVFEAALQPDADTTFVCAHGAGGHRDDRGMLALAEQLRGRGLHVVRFNFLYREKGSGRPDAMPLLKQCIVEVVDRARREIQSKHLIIGGRSMGGRAASMLAADGFSAAGLLLLAYPLHPAGKPEQLRDAHLPQITMPTLCLNGTRDTLCRRDLMEQVVSRLSSAWTMHWLEGADHSFHVLKSSGRTDTQVLSEIGQETAAWLARADTPRAR
jgi:predicted alpha/beta-hydrolase family hydrolase